MSLDAWRKLVEKELAGAPIASLAVETPDGFAIEPLYTEARPEPGLPGAAPFTRGARAQAGVAVCMRHGADGRASADDVAAIEDDLAGGADALWISADDGEALQLAIGLPSDPEPARRVFVVLDTGRPRATLDAVFDAAGLRGVPARSLAFALAADPIGERRRAPDAAAPSLDDALRALGVLARDVGEMFPRAVAGLVSVVADHDAGLPAADQLARALSTGAAYLDAMLDEGLDVAAAARQLGVQVAIGRDTFGELCKLRALRTCWHKLLAAAGAPDAPLPLLHAVARPGVPSEKEPWGNALRGTTQAFAAILGGADLVTPVAYDEHPGPASPLGRRTARNTVLVLREESHLGRVIDPAGGAYYFEARTDALARAAWARFRAIEERGGARALLAGGGAS